MSGAGGADGAVHGSDTTDPGLLCEPRCGDERERADQKPPVGPGEDRERPGELHNGSPGVVEHAEEQVGGLPRVFAQETGRAAGLDLVDAVQREPDGVREDLLAGIAARQAEAWPAMRARVLRAIEQSQQRGFCTAAYQQGHLLAVGAAFRGPDQQLYGLNISFPYSASERRRDNARYAAKLARLMDDIQSAWQQAGGG